MQISLAFNHFGKGLVQRMPRCRFGFFHVLNNDYTHWIMYAIGGTAHPTIISQGNRFIAPPDPTAKMVTFTFSSPRPIFTKHSSFRYPNMCNVQLYRICGHYLFIPLFGLKQITNRNNVVGEEWKNWIWRSENDVFLNGAYFVESGHPLDEKRFKKDFIKSKPGTYVRRLTRFAGQRRCIIGKSCQMYYYLYLYVYFVLQHFIQFK